MERRQKKKQQMRRNKLIVGARRHAQGEGAFAPPGKVVKHFSALVRVTNKCCRKSL